MIPAHVAAELLTANVQKTPGEPPRSPQWDATRRRFIEKHPHCAACPSHATPAPGSLNVHHMVPFHFVIACGRPDLELDFRNLITLCEAGENHHLVVGHLADWESYNRSVAHDARGPYHGDASAKIETLQRWTEERAARPKHLDAMSPAERHALNLVLDQLYPRHP